MKKYYKFNLDMVWANVIATIVLVVSAVVFLFFDRTYQMDINIIIYMVLYLALHEVFHGIAFSIYAKDIKNIKYGAALEKGVFYAMCQERINKKAIIVSLLFPFIFLTVIALPIGVLIHSENLIILALINFSGATGDLFMVNLIRKMPKDIEYIDYDNSVGCYLLSKEDLSKYKAIGLKYVESGKDEDKLINKDIKRITISKWSVIILAILIIDYIILKLL